MKTESGRGQEPAPAARYGNSHFPQPHSQPWLARLRTQLEESCRVKEQIPDELLACLWRWAEASKEALESGHRIFWFGNGGSAADAQHLAAELVGRMAQPGRRALASVALTTNSSVLTALANDFDFPTVFARQIEALVLPGDIVVGITTSGQSPNVLLALAAARQQGAVTACLTGANGRALEGSVDFLMAVPSLDPQRIQESHITLGHIYCGLLDDYFGDAPKPAGAKTERTRREGIR